ncbi:hypothetical protein BG844_28280 [Couchioplanes caeruleus subsp. caeruleus]|uniref:Uncharacterized protein n=1 Tax=Couchioplanes caeruleus subsp. caeruleus TaxID=56427 RepID=A0A1K0G180_9ACTN|nr:hypothetical protein BG844_28280 [Couchioplanes caeruleus subsp. caeruleus]
MELQSEPVRFTSSPPISSVIHGSRATESGPMIRIALRVVTSMAIARMRQASSSSAPVSSRTVR